MNSNKAAAILMLGLCAAIASNGLAQRDFADVEIVATEVSGGVYMLKGAGGNLGLITGEDGAFLVDDQFAPLTDKIQAAVGKIHSGPIRFVVNTHWHGDHTGGNENLGGAGSIIVAHDNVRKRMSTEQFNELWNRTTPPSPAGALPVVTFSEGIRFHLNGETIHVLHLPPAHTDGDAIIHFEKANVIHAGDIFFNGIYPFVDVFSGGSAQGVVDAVDKILSLCDGNTKIIPGHGELATRKELQVYRDMMQGVVSAVKKAMAGNADLDQVKAQKPTAQWDEIWGGGFMKPDTFVQLVYLSLGGR